MAATRDVAEHRPAANERETVKEEREEPSQTRFNGNGTIPGVADTAKYGPQSASERAYNDEPKGADVNMKPAYVHSSKNWSLDVDETSGRMFLAITVQNRMVEYDEWYEIDKATFDKFMANPELALPMVEQAKRRQIDHLLLLPPGTDRGFPL